MTKQERKKLAGEEYLKIINPAEKEYEKIRNPAYEEYKKIRNSAEKEYLKIINPALEEYKNEVKEIDSKDEKVCDKCGRVLE